MKIAHVIKLAAVLLATGINVQLPEALACAQPEAPSKPSAKERLRFRQERGRQEAFLAPELKELNKVCGARITAKIDWNSIHHDHYSNAANYCTHALESVERLCADHSGQVDAAGKEAVTDQIKSVSCSHGQERVLGLRDGTLYFQSDFKASDDRSTIIEFLRNNL
jgi:hypothetical protein